VLQRMLHQRRLARTWLSFDAEHSIVGRQIGSILPFLEFEGVEQPVTRVFDGGANVLLAQVDLEEAEGAEAGCDVSDVWRYIVGMARVHTPSLSFCGAPPLPLSRKLIVVLSPVVTPWSTLSP